MWIVSGLLSILTIGWVVAILISDSVDFVLPNATGRPGLEMFLALGHLFGALVLALSSHRPPRPGMQWAAMGFLVLGIGTLSFGYLVNLLHHGPNPNLTMYGSVLTRCFATALIAIGLVPERPPSLNLRGALTILASGGVATILFVAAGNWLPELLSTENWVDSLTTGNYRTLPGLTWGYFALSTLPLLMSYLAIWGAVRQVRRDYVSGWLVIGLVIYSGAQLHGIFWPSMNSTILTSTSVLRFAWTLIIIVGCVLELYALSRERSDLLLKEQEHVRQLEDIGTMKRDFTSMVAHELGTPLAAINNLAQMMTTGLLPDAEKQKAAYRIQNEARLLQLLVRDVQESNSIDHDAFSIDLRRVPLSSLLEDARAYVETVRRCNPVTLEVSVDTAVSADPDRIGQVIRNLLNNAVRHTPAETPIRLSAIRDNNGIRISVIDRGPGIPPEDRPRIFEKFGRGSTVSADGAGLGLYLSQRILQAHGSELTIESELGQGSVFSFSLEEAL